MNSKTFILLVFINLFGISLSAQNAIDILQEDNFFKNAHIGFSLIDIENGKEVQALNSRQFFYPASVQKLITTNIALLLVGKDFQFETKVYTTGTIENGVLNGNLIIEASGDPTLNSRRFKSADFLDKLLKTLESKNINTISGEILLKEKQQRVKTPQTWLYEDVANYYASIPQLFNFKDNSYTIHFKSGDDNTIPIVKSILPAVPYSFDYALKSSSTIKGDQAYILGPVFSTERQIVGTIPAQREQFKIKGANAHPFYSFATALKTKIPVQDKKIIHEKSNLLFTHKSAKLTDIVKQCNWYSDNFLAESILCQVGQSAKRDYKIDDGIHDLENFIAISKLNENEIRIKDGSGLSRLNAVTPHFMSDFLCTFEAHQDFTKTIPVAGISGTMKKFSASTVKGKITAKSGTASGHVNYAGYVKASNGKKYAFSLFISQIYGSSSQINQKLTRFFEALVATDISE